MAKTAKQKKKSQANLRPNSRALRRQTSPSLTGNIDRSLKELPRPQSPDPTKTATPYSILASNAPSSRISKKPKRGKHSRAQRLRSEKNKEKAQRNRDVLDGKVNGSWDHARRVRARKEGWEMVQETLKSADSKADEGKDDGENEYIDIAVAQEADTRPLKEKMEVVDLVEAQDALGGLVVSEEAVAPEDEKAQEIQMDMGREAEQVKNSLATAFQKPLVEASSRLPDAEDGDDTNDIT